MRFENMVESIINEANASVILDEPMARHTSLKIGGSADIFVSPKGIDSLRKVIQIAQKNQVKTYIIGNGTNLLVSDDGIRGMVILIKEGMERVIVRKSKLPLVKAEAGVMLSKVLNVTTTHGLSGFEFAAGIPGSIGGAVAMNASTRLGAISELIHSIEVLTREGAVQKLRRKQLDFHYRQLNLESGAIILNSVFCLRYGDKAEVGKRVDDFLKERRDTQPKGSSAGCIFKNPPGGGSAGKIIDELGLKGKRTGGAYVSGVHANFIMNDGTATCKDFVALIRQIREIVEKKRNIKLEYEIKFLWNM